MSQMQLKRAKKLPAKPTASDGREIRFDAFLSHKRTEAQDTVARCHDKLVDLGYRAFIDRNDLVELPSLKLAVRDTATFVAFLTPQYFASAWCCLELVQAVENNVPIFGVYESRQGMLHDHVQSELREKCERAFAPGLKWTNVGAVAPTGGRELTNAKLSFALKRKTDFKAEDLATFELGQLQPTDYIKSGGSYFQLAMTGEAHIEKMECAHYLAPRCLRDAPAAPHAPSPSTPTAACKRQPL